MQPYQKTIELGVVYETHASGIGNGNALQAFIEVVGGTVNILGSVHFPKNDLSNMTNATPTGFSGIENFGIIPNYLCVTQKTGTTTSIILSGVEATEASTA